ncbi:hypothetical protein GGI04_004256, partial [Coemansia thaxteri]
HNNRDRDVGNLPRAIVHMDDQQCPPHAVEPSQPPSHVYFAASDAQNKHYSIAESIPNVHTTNIARTSKSFHVIIIGGSFAGIRAAQDLESMLPSRLVTITVIDRRDQYFYNLGALRALVKPELIDLVWLPYNHVFRYPHNKVIQGEVSSVYPNAVILKDGRKLDFDSLLVATGSVYPPPCKVEMTSHMQGKAELHAYGEMVKTADAILIIGGGPTGVGLAAEIATVYPKKATILVHAGERLLSSESASKSVSRKAYKKLKSMGVKVILGERVIIPEDEPLTNQIECRWLKTSKGRMLFSNMQFLCNGITFETSLMDTLDPVFRHKIIDSTTGQIKVLPTMQLDHSELPWIFSAGDVCNTAGEKQAYRADSQGSHVAKCMARMAQAWAHGLSQWYDVPLKHWHDPAQFMSVAMGPSAGVTDTPWIVLGDMPTRILKSRELFLARRYREFNLEYPGTSRHDEGDVHLLESSSTKAPSAHHHRFGFMFRHNIEQRIRARGGVTTNLSPPAYNASNAVASAAMVAASHHDHQFDCDRVSLSRPMVRRTATAQSALVHREDINARQYESASESDGSDCGCSSGDECDECLNVRQVPTNQYACTAPHSQRQHHTHASGHCHHPYNHHHHRHRRHHHHHGCGGKHRAASLDADSTASGPSSTHTEGSSSSATSRAPSHTSTLLQGPVIPRHARDRAMPVCRSFHKAQDYFLDEVARDGYPPVPPLPHALVTQMSHASISSSASPSWPLSGHVIFAKDSSAAPIKNLI